MPEIRARAKNTFSIRIFLGRDLDGKRHFLNKTIKGTKNDAERWANREGKVLSSNARKRLNSAREQHGKLSIVGNKTSKYWKVHCKGCNELDDMTSTEFHRQEVCNRCAHIAHIKNTFSPRDDQYFTLIELHDVKFILSSRDGQPQQVRRKTYFWLCQCACGATFQLNARWLTRTRSCTSCAVHRGRLKPTNPQQGMPSLPSDTSKKLPRTRRTLRTPESPWTETEDRLLLSCATQIPASIQSTLKQSGYKRNRISIADRVRELSLLSHPPLFTSEEVMQLLGLSVDNLIDLTNKRKLKPQQPWIHPKPLLFTRHELKRFLLYHHEDYDLQNVDQVFFRLLLLKPATQCYKTTGSTNEQTQGFLSNSIGPELLEFANRTVPRWIENEIREDVCQELIAALLDGTLTKEEATANIKSVVKQVRAKLQNRYVEISLDSPLSTNSHKRLSDIIEG